MSRGASVILLTDDTLFLFIDRIQQPYLGCSVIIILCQCLQCFDTVVFGKQSTNSYTANPPHRFPPLLLALHLQTPLLLFSLAKYPNSALLTPATLPHHLRTHPLLLPLPLIFSLYPCIRIRSLQDPVQLSKQAIWVRSDPHWLLKECSSFLVPTITNIVNHSLISGQFHPTLKESIISLLLKKPTLDKEELSNYRPISNLSHFQNNRTCCQIPSHGSPHFQQFTQFSPVSLLQTSLHRNSSFAHLWSPHQCNSCQKWVHKKCSGIKGSIRYDTKCYFNVRSKADISQLNLPHGTDN